MSRFWVNLQGVEGRGHVLGQTPGLQPPRGPAPASRRPWSRRVGPTGAKAEKQMLAALLNLI